MIVRDEAHVVERCLESVRPLVDRWVVCDTGSTDDTEGRVRAAFADVPGELHRRRWRNFGANRTELMRLAKGAADYLLLLDADMTLRIDGELPQLTADAYLLRHAGSLDYAVPRLVRGDRSWRFVGSTHEYLAGDGEHTQEVLDLIVVQHHADGGTRAEKFERDARLLEADLRDHPDDPRTTFYLAQTYRDLGRTEEAVALYLRRAELGGWNEEIFYALYQAGVLRSQSDPDAALRLLLDAWESRPARAEPLHELARLSRCAGRHHAAYLYANRGLELPYPDDVLFVERSVYEWGLLFEFAIAAYWVGEVDAALQANERLLAERRYPPELERFVLGNRDHCLRRSGRSAIRGPAVLRALAPSTELGEFRLDVEPAWPQFNPSIAAAGEGYRTIVRTANYRIEQGAYVFLGDAQVIETINYLVELDRSLTVRRVAPIDDRADGPPRHPSRVLGYEDCRLVRVGDSWAASATVRDRNPDELCEVALLKVDGDAITDVTLLPAGEPGAHEKNWMPFTVDGLLHFLYSCAPTVVLRCDPRSGEVERIAYDEGPAEARRLRGGSQGLPAADGVLFVAHEASDTGGRRVYTHRLVLLDRDHRVTALSPPFSFTGEAIEFCAGLAPHGSELLLTFGVNDCSARIARVNAGELLGLFEPVAA